MVEELFNEIIYCLIDFIEGVTRAVIRLAKCIENLSVADLWTFFRLLILFGVAHLIVVSFVKWLAVGV